MRHTFTPRLAVLTLAHFTIDSYSSFFSPLLPLLVERLGLSLTLVGTLVAIASLSSSFSQPLFGLIADRLRRPWFVAFGPLVAAVFLSAVGLAPNFAALVMLLVLGGIGVAAFHPQAAALASVSSPKRASAMSLWVTGGTLGWALGPLFAVSTLGGVGLERTWVAAIPGALLSLVLFAWFARAVPIARRERRPTRLSDLRPHAGPLTLLYFAVVFRSAVSYGFMTFLPLWLTSRGWSVAAAGTLTTVYLTMGAIGGFLGGGLADRWGGRRVVVASYALAIPFFAAFLYWPDGPGLAALLIGYCVLQTALPVNTVMGQELAPEHAGTISSLLMGFAWGVGAMLIGPIGALSDRWGLHAGLAVLSCLLFAGLGCAVCLPIGHAPARAPSAT